LRGEKKNHGCYASLVLLRIRKMKVEYILNHGVIVTNQ